MIEVKADGGKVLIGGRPLSYDEARDLVHRIWATIPVGFDQHGTPICPKCDIEAIEDAPGFWVCGVIECDGYHQTVFERRTPAVGPRRPMGSAA